jgi:cytochrome c-type biogenesis protein CcmH
MTHILLPTTALLILALACVLTPLLRQTFQTLRRLDEARHAVKLLEDAHTAGTVDRAEYTSRRAVLGEEVWAILNTVRKRLAPRVYAAVAVTIAIPLAALGTYRWLGTPVEHGIPASVFAAASALTSGDTAAPDDHGADMQAAIAKLAEKLRRHPDDADGWALMGRTYKAMQHYEEARDAFGHALQAAPGDTNLEREYAAAETPNDSAESSDAVQTADQGTASEPNMPAALAPSAPSASLGGPPRS